MLFLSLYFITVNNLTIRPSINKELTTFYFTKLLQNQHPGNFEFRGLQIVAYNYEIPEINLVFPGGGNSIISHGCDN